MKLKGLNLFILIFLFFLLIIAAYFSKTGVANLNQNKQLSEEAKLKKVEEQTLKLEKLKVDCSFQENCENYTKLVNKALDHLSKKLSTHVSEISIKDAKEIQWNDGSLGCPQPGAVYTQAVVPGYKITLENKGNLYNYHADKTSIVIFCQSR